MRFQLLHTIIASGDSVSSTVDLKGGKFGGLIATIVTSADVYLQVSWDTTSANFVRAWKPDGSAVWDWAVASGNAAIDLKDVGIPFPHCRLETGVAQADTASLTFVTKL